MHARFQHASDYTESVGRSISPLSQYQLHSAPLCSTRVLSQTGQLFFGMCGTGVISSQRVGEGIMRFRTILHGFIEVPPLVVHRPEVYKRRRGVGIVWPVDRQHDAQTLAV